MATLILLYISLLEVLQLEPSGDQLQHSCVRSASCDDRHSFGVSTMLPDFQRTILQSCCLWVIRALWCRICNSTFAQDIGQPDTKKTRTNRCPIPRTEELHFGKQEPMLELGWPLCPQPAPHSRLRDSRTRRCNSPHQRDSIWQRSLSDILSSSSCPL